jgi:hypothetical protein
MSSPSTLAEKIAMLIAEEAKPDNGVAPILAALEKINARLDKLETAAAKPVASTHSHPSFDKFSIAEAIADQVFGSKEKTCTFEPNDRPCDHCSMCSSRGF